MREVHELLQFLIAVAGTRQEAQARLRLRESIDLFVQENV